MRTRVALFLAFDMAFSSSCCSRDPALPFPGSPLLTARRHAVAGCRCQDLAGGAIKLVQTHALSAAGLTGNRGSAPMHADHTCNCPLLVHLPLATSFAPLVSYSKGDRLVRFFVCVGS